MIEGGRVRWRAAVDAAISHALRFDVSRTDAVKWAGFARNMLGVLVLSVAGTAGLTAGTVGDNTDLFINRAGRTQASTNLVNGSTLPSDQSHVTLALRCFVWYRNPMLRIGDKAHYAELPAGVGLHFYAFFKLVKIV